MTIIEMHRQVRLRSQKVNSFQNDNFLTEEVDEYLNMAINQLVKDRIENQSNMMQVAFEQSLKRYEDLKTLVVKNASTSITSVTSGQSIDGLFVDRIAFPSDNLYFLNLRCNVHYARSGFSFTTPASQRVASGSLNTNYLSKIVPARRVQTDDIYALLRDPFNKTTHNSPAYDISENGIDVYTDDTFLVSDAFLNYIKTPATVLNDTATPGNNVNCDLPVHTHDEVVELAVAALLADIDKFGPQGQMQELKELE